MTIKCTNYTNQSFFSIKGYLNIVGNGNVYLHTKNNIDNTGSYKIVDSCEIKNGNFNFKNESSEPQIAFLEFHLSEKTIFTRPFWIDNNNIEVECTFTNNNLEIDIDGSKTEEDAEEHGNFWLYPLTISQINNKIDKESDSLIKEALINESLQLKNNHFNKIKSIVEKNRSSFFVLYGLANAINYISFNQLKELYSIIDKKNLQLPTGKFLTNYIQKLSSSEIGKEFSKFEVSDINGKKVILPPKNNKIILVEFWASWCRPCIEDISKLNLLYNKYDKKKLEIYSISIDDDIEKWQKATVKNKIIWNSFLALESTDSLNLKKNYPLYHIPQNLILINGVVFKKNLRGSDLDNTIDSLLNSYALNKKLQ
jgi:thiol-disulfide isomerase/thioredoxin